MSNVEIVVQSQLKKLVSDLEAISKASKALEQELAKNGETTSDSTEKATKKTEKALEGMRSLAARVSKQIYDDFKSLASINAIQGALGLSGQFSGSLKETFSLNDAIRKLGTTFGIAANNFGAFQDRMISGLGKVGLSSQVAADTMQALVDTPVRGEESLLAYSQTAGELASLSNQKGQEGGTAKGIAEVIRAQGGNPNDLNQMRSVAEDLRRVFNVTGKAPTETLKAMQGLFESMPKDLRNKIGTRGAANLAAAEQSAGPGSTKFFEEFLGKSPILRKALDAQGFGNVLSDKGIDTEKFGKASQSILGRIGFDPEAAAQTLGISEEAAKGFVRLSQSLQKVKEAQDKVNNYGGSIEDQYKSSMGAMEAFRASINRVKGTLTQFIPTQKISNLLSGASQSGLGSAAVVGGGGLLAALLAGGGLRGLGGGLLGGMVKGKAIEEITGEKVQKVEVINFPAGFGLGGAGAGAAAGGLGIVGKAGLVGAAGAGGVAVGMGVNMLLDKYDQGTTKEGFEGNGVERLFAKLDLLLGGRLSGVDQKYLQNQKIQVHLDSKQLPASVQPRGKTTF